MAVRTDWNSGKLPARCRAVLVGVVGLAIMAAITVPGKAQSNRIESVSIVSESADTVTFEIIYAYAGDRGDDVFMSVVMAQDGERSPYYGYVPGQVRSGRHRTRVALSASERAPDLFSTNQVEIGMYVGGGASYLRQSYAFAKTWSQPRASLTAVPRIVATPQIAGQVAVQLANPQIQQLQAVQAAGPTGRFANPAGGTSGGGDLPERRVLSDGSIELRYPDGTVRIRTTSGETVILPDGTRQIYSYANAQPPSPPSLPADPAHANWVTAELESLLGVIGTLVANDQASIDHYLTQEGAGLSPYVRINLRTRTIGMLVRP